MTPFIDPRLGDVEDDASSTKQRSLLAIAGSLLAEISLPKLIVAWVSARRAAGPAAWLRAAHCHRLARDALDQDRRGARRHPAAAPARGGDRGRLVRRHGRCSALVEHGFWSLNSVAIQPVYALCREALRHLLERVLLPKLTAGDRAWLGAATAAGAAVILCVIAGVIVL